MRFFPISLFLLIAGLGTWSAYQFGYERFEKSALVTSAERLSLYQATLRSTLARVSHLPRVMVMHPHTRDLIKGTTNIEAYNKYLESVSDSAGSAALYILDAEGTTIAASNYATDESFVGNNYRFRKYYSDAIKNGKADFFAVGVTTGRPGYFLSEAVIDNGQPIGVAVSKVEFIKLLEDWRSGGETVLITNEDGIVVLASNEAHLYKMTRAVSPERISEMKETRKFSNFELEPLDFKAGNDLFEGRISLDSEDFAVSSIDTAAPGWRMHYLTPLASVRSSSYVFAGITLLLFGILAIALLYVRARIERTKLQVTATEAERVKEANIRLEKEISERKRTEIQLRETQAELIQSSRLAALGQMSAAIVHEVNQPVSAIRTFTSSGELLIKEKRLPEAKDVFHQIKLMTERLGSITSDLLIFSRKPVSQPVPVDLNEVVNTIAGQNRPELGMLEIKLDLELAENSVPVRGSRVRFEQLIGNLIKNAMQASETAENAEIHINTKAIEDRVILTVSDNGAGVPSEIIDQLFDPFFTTKDVGKGVGLGLALCYAITDEASGKIRCENRTEGGASFIVDLPLADEAKSSASKELELEDG